MPLSRSKQEASLSRRVEHLIDRVDSLESSLERLNELAAGGFHPDDEDRAVLVSNLMGSTREAGNGQPQQRPQYNGTRP